MTMPPWSDDPEESRPYFARLREVAGQHGLRELSMGTSQDYRVAAEEGATYVRVGSTILGERREREFDDWTDATNDRTQTQVAPPRLRGVEALPAGSGAPATVHLVVPRSFNDAQQIADKFKESIPVILNLQGSDQELSKRLIDFASGLTYALDGGMQRVADKVFLLTPRNVEVSAEERARMLERGGFFNQA